MESATGEDGDSGAVWVIEIVVGSLKELAQVDERRKNTYPEPIVLEIGTDGRRCYVHIGMRCETGGIDTTDWTLCDLEVRSQSTTNACVDVPETRAARSVEVVFDQYRTRGWSLGLDQHI